MIEPEHIPFDGMTFHGYTVGKAFGMGQQGPIDEAIASVKAFISKYAIYLVAIGGGIGFLGSTLAKGGPLEGTITVAGGVILAMGLLPLIVGALS